MATFLHFYMTANTSTAGDARRDAPNEPRTMLKLLIYWVRDRDSGSVVESEKLTGRGPIDQGAIGDGATSGRSGAGLETGTGSAREEWATLQTSVPGIRSEGAEQRHGTGERES